MNLVYIWSYTCVESSYLLRLECVLEVAECTLVASVVVVAAAVAVVDQFDLKYFQY
jgi:hypothetical protein